MTTTQELIQFDNLINPNNIKCYIIKTHEKMNYAKEEVTYYNIQEIIDLYNNGLDKQFGVDLSLLNLFFIDSDSRRDTEYLDEILEGVNYIKIKSLKKYNSHYYFKYDDRIEPGKIQGTLATVHDWYRLAQNSPFCPVIPFNNNRTILKLPETLDYLPEEIGIRIFSNKNLITIDEDIENNIKMEVFEDAIPENYNPKMFLYKGARE